jgi:hypothetical protein
MASVIISDFGKNEEGVRTYRVNGEKVDLEKAIEELREVGWGFWAEPKIEVSHKHWTVLLKIYNPKEYEDAEEEKEEKE